MFNNMEREAGDQILEVKNLRKELNGQVLFDNLNFDLNKGEKVALLSRNNLATTAFYNIIMGLDDDYTGEYKWGVTITPTYLPSENKAFFEGLDTNLIDWLREYSEEKDETFIRGFLGKMLFSGEETLKNVKVLSGGEKMRCMLSRMMMLRGNMLLLDEPTNHLDLESITALNNGLDDFKGNIILTSRDHQLNQTIADRVIEIAPSGMIDRYSEFDEYLADENLQSSREELYSVGV